MFISSGGRSSPKLSLPISVAHISPVSGWKVKKTEFLNPPANSAVTVPSGSDSKIAARFQLSSMQTSQEEPTDMYNLFLSYSPLNTFSPIKSTLRVLEPKDI